MFKQLNLSKTILLILISKLKAKRKKYCTFGYFNINNNHISLTKLSV